MAYTLATWSPDGKLGAVSLKAAALITADGTSTAVETGKGKFRIVLTTTAVEAASNDELYVVEIEANTRAATSTWYAIGTVAVLGAAEVTGRESDNADAGVYEVIIDNPYDYQLRERHYVNGTIATGCNYSVDADPLIDKV
jgi:hypothetical protein